MQFFQKIIFGAFLGILVVLTISSQMETAHASGIVDTLQSTVGNLLPNYFDQNAHQEANAIDPGPSGINSAIMYVTDFMKYIVGSLAILYLFISAYRLITAGDEIEEVINKQKQSFTYILIGFVVIILSTTLVKDVFSPTGEIDFLESISFAEEAGIEAQAHIRGLYRFIQGFIGAIAILVIVIAAFQMMIGGGDEQTLESKKKHIIWALVGLIVIGISEFVVQEIIFEDYGKEIDFLAAEFLIGGIVSFFTEIIAIIAVLMVIYAGFLYVTARGEDEPIQTAKKILWGAVIAIALTAGAYAITSTFITLQP